MSKVWPLLSMLNEKFINYFEFLKTMNPSIDESMVPYYGRQSAKQFICGKPIRFGYKMSVLTTTLGYVVQIELYQGAQVQQTQYEGLGMGGSVVMDLPTEFQSKFDLIDWITLSNRESYKWNVHVAGWRQNAGAACARSACTTDASSSCTHHELFDSVHASF